LIPFLFGTNLALFEILADDYSSPLTVLHNICLLLYWSRSQRIAASRAIPNWTKYFSIDFSCRLIHI